MLCSSLQHGACSLNIKRLLLIKENQISQFKKFSAFLYMGRCKSLDLLKSFLSRASQPSGASSLQFDYSYSQFLAHHREWWQLVVEARLLSDSRHCSSWAQKFISGGLDSRMPGTSLFIEMAGNIAFHSTEVKKHKTFFL